ncbi:MULTISPECIES: cysteine hydrolase family protein [Staphylococcus]|uniref:Cysteine hydrolase n=1 Tax=Staphylococcus agnetis TaxID=985762 RepID=A0A2T4MRF0_9STAP|nr:MULTISPECIES: isochorismatase family cysteine hydrolase [Staphylococcus]ALN76892.1 cysteine hydrolase [Staphylococcus agnetis]KFE41328.1 isochorismatase family protein [Staphylococcus agnetis]MBY7664593.1 cysteine hydrolase [Staphylococcus agnetis]MCO4326332.1 cysteine hydrolase [Staphylococcus agnetis]MCO4357165.1 cysteine hydrolase [Staphylococcus agnetis]
MSKRALIVVDYSNDFIADNGKLTCGGAGQAIEGYIVDRIQHYHDKKENIFFMMDLHFENDPTHPESKSFPPHNIIGTEGRKLYGQVGSVFQTIEHEEHVFFIDKRRYDSFFGTPLDTLLRERKIDTLEIVGVCTDICVLHTASTAYNLNYQLVIPKDGVASFNELGHEWALAHFKNTLGATVE